MSVENIMSHSVAYLHDQWVLCHSRWHECLGAFCWLVSLPVWCLQDDLPETCDP